MTNTLSSNPERLGRQTHIRWLIDRLKSGKGTPVGCDQYLISTDPDTLRIRITRFSKPEGGEPEFEFWLSAQEAEWIGERLAELGFAAAAVQREENGEIN